MQYVTRKIFPYVIGAAIGAFVGWSIADYYLKAKAEKEDDLVEGEWHPYEEVKGEEEVDEAPVVLKRDKKKSTSKRDYTKFAEKGTLSEAVEQFLGNQAKEEDEEEHGSIYVISMEQYSDNNFGLEHLVVTYYEGDDTLAMDNDEIITDPVAILGQGWSEKFGEESEDPDCVYIRNENLGIEYEVIRSHEKYSVVVAGIPEKDPPKPPKGRRSHSKKKNEELEDSEE